MNPPRQNLDIFAKYLPQISQIHAEISVLICEICGKETTKINCLPTPVGRASRNSQD